MQWRPGPRWPKTVRLKINKARGLEEDRELRRGGSGEASLQLGKDGKSFFSVKKEKKADDE